MTAPVALDFICPRCRSPVHAAGEGYICGICDRFYPVLFGIPDFRLSGDQYLALEEERAKAGRLHAYGLKHDFAALVAFYYSITDDVPPKLARTFANYVLKASGRAGHQLQLLAPPGGNALLDLGCGSGGALVAGADHFKVRTGVDIALRWLVIAQKRLKEAGVDAQLVCADAEALPFANRTFSHVLASDFIENARAPKAALCSAASVMETGGRIYISASNGRWVGPHPATGIWSAGLIPERARSSLLTRRHSIDVLRAVSFVGPASVRQMARTCDLRHLTTKPFVPDKEQLIDRPAIFRMFARIYALLAKAPIAQALLVAAGPAFQSLFVKEGTT